MDINDIKKNILSPNSDAYQFLYSYYDDQLNRGVQMSDLLKNLRNIAREIDRITNARESRLDTFLNTWSPNGNYPSVEKALSAVHNPDRQFAVQAHDLAEGVQGHTELATANPNDFIRNGRKQLILSNTSLDDIVDLSI